MSETVGEATKGTVRGARSDERSFEGVGGPVEVQLGDSDEEIGRVGKRILVDDIVREELYDGCFESWGGFFAEGCSHGLREGEE